MSNTLMSNTLMSNTLMSNTLMSNTMTATKLDRITVNPARMNGQPTVRNLRLTVKRVLEILALYPEREEIRKEYPELEDEDIHQALLYAAASLDDKVVEFTYELVA